MATSSASKSKPSDIVQDPEKKSPLSELYDVIFGRIPNPPARPVTITVKRNAKGVPVDVIVRPDVATLAPNEQLVWSSPDARIEIRFSRDNAVFLGTSFEVPRGAKVFSGVPAQKPSKRIFKYTVLVTTQDGIFLTKEAQVVVAVSASSKK